MYFILPLDWQIVVFFCNCFSCRLPDLVFDRHSGRECSFTSAFYNSQVRDIRFVQLLRRKRWRKSKKLTADMLFLSTSNNKCLQKQGRWADNTLFVVVKTHDMTEHDLSSFFFADLIHFLHERPNSAYKSTTMSGYWRGRKKRESTWISFAFQSPVHVTSEERPMSRISTSRDSLNCTSI